MKTSIYLFTTNGFVNVTKELEEDIKQEVDYNIALEFQKNMLQQNKAISWVVQNNTVN